MNRTDVTKAAFETGATSDTYVVSAHIPESTDFSVLFVCLFVFVELLLLQTVITLIGPMQHIMFPAQP